MSRSGPVALPQAFYEANLITGVLQVVQSGKEGTVYCCQAHHATGREYLAAKLYRPREFRSFQNDAVYQQGRIVQGTGTRGDSAVGKGRRDRRLGRAVKKKSRIGRGVQFESWVGAEYSTLSRLYAAGADVPRPFDWSGSAILMEYVGDGDGPAPQLCSVTLAPGEARPLFERVVRNIEICLACDVIHGDLSAFNILYWKGSVKIIDFPQAVDLYLNRSAFALLARDVENVCDYFLRCGVRADPSRLARQLWSRALRPEG